jgi:ethanolamine transporter EutH
MSRQILVTRRDAYSLSENLALLVLGIIIKGHHHFLALGARMLMLSDPVGVLSASLLTILSASLL